MTAERRDLLTELSYLKQFLHVAFYEQPCLLKPLNCISQATCDGVVVLDGFNKGLIRAHLKVQWVDEELIDDAVAHVEKCGIGLRGSLFVALYRFLKLISGCCVDKLAK